ncbi:Crp/Fnr family transcriptional regulator [Chryseosolibacter indicus]|uniref:Crp/Fnr family transcriptional regulator n=1 Tax=Chryseosolibacter indicus TaxID=2782351 RepID=A0ABS5VUP8_9BACT|nr:Crp/Fnr family transcriptional regulator [Chryseosolibacter indicus]MBT1705150.1 Crp/Fnr family transcriptional regulator [Chryseosolibacter indicus]
MGNLTTFLNNFSEFTPDAVNDLNCCIVEESFLKGDVLVQKGRVCGKLIYIKKGLVKLSFEGDYKEFIMRFFSENALSTVLDSFLNQTPSSYRIVAIEPTEISYITFYKIEELCRKHHCVEAAFRKFIAHASTNMMARISEMLEEDGTQRYHNFLKQNPSLMQRISLGDLASYLGITQVSLSRIRSKQ